MSLDAKKINLKTLFTDNWFLIPSFQRPYVWGKDEIDTLLEDIHVAATSELEEYFVGNIVFHESKSKGYTEAVVLDGQQRLTSIFLFFLVAYQLLEDQTAKQTCLQMIRQDENPFTKTPKRVRIEFEVREDVTSLIDSKIEDFAKNVEHRDISAITMNRAMAFIENWITENKAILNKLLTYLLNNVFVVSITSTKLSDAFRIFTIINNRGIKLRNSDILKAENIQNIPEDKRIVYAKEWERIESNFCEYYGSDDAMDNLLLLIRTIYVRQKAQKSLYEEFKELIYAKGKLKYGVDTFDIVKKYMQHFDDVYDELYILDDRRLYNLVRMLDCTVKTDMWLPVILYYKEKFQKDNLINFLIKLENKFSFDLITGVSFSNRLKNMNNILEVIDKCNNPSQIIDDKSMQYSTKDLEPYLASTDIYHKQFAKYILAKLNFIIGSGTKASNTLIFDGSIEHILPQKPSSDSNWGKDFTVEEQEKYTNTIGNLILLNRRKNSSLGNLDFDDKKNKYFKDTINIYPHSIKVMSEHTSWKPSDISENNKAMLEVLMNWYNAKN